MSRIGKKPIVIPEGVEVEIKEDLVLVKCKNQELVQKIPSAIKVKVEDNNILVTRSTDLKEHRSLHGLIRSLIANMVHGVKEGFSKTLEINGIGYRAQMNGDTLVLNLGYSHPVEFKQPKGITLEVPQPNRIIVKGADKQMVGEVAAKIRRSRLPDAYKGKGIKYDYETLRLKVGKTGAK